MHDTRALERALYFWIAFKRRLKRGRQPIEKVYRCMTPRHWRDHCTFGSPFNDAFEGKGERIEISCIHDVLPMSPISGIMYR
jgi:hypothetical protein